LTTYYVAIDVHSQSSYGVVTDKNGKSVNQCVMETTSKTMLHFVKALSGKVYLTFEEGNHSAWLYDLLKPYVYKLIVCDPAKISREEKKDDRTDAQLLVDKLRNGSLSPVYHGDNGTRKLKELVRGYQNVLEDNIRVKNRIKAVFRSRGIGTRGKSVYDQDSAEEWLAQLKEPGLRQRVALLYEELAVLTKLRDLALKDMNVEARKHKACRLLCDIPGIGPIRSAVVVSVVDTPFRFRTKRQFWSYCGLAVVTHSSSDYELFNGAFRKKKRHGTTRGLNRNFNRHLKAVFKGAANDASFRGALKPYYGARIDAKMKPEMALLVVARKLAAMSLAIWKKGERFDLNKALMRTE